MADGAAAMMLLLLAALATRSLFVLVPLYAVVLGVLACLIAIFTILSSVYR